MNVENIATKAVDPKDLKQVNGVAVIEDAKDTSTEAPLQDGKE